MALWGLEADGKGFTTRFGSALCPVRQDGVPAMLTIAGHAEERRGGGARRDVCLFAPAGSGLEIHLALIAEFPVTP
jgi:hypothetical protein